jgi:ABC-type transport system involved in multi-copper enzyme maturation permease subunit
VIRLIRAEFLKLRSTQVWFWLLLVAVALSALAVIGPLASHGDVQNGSDVADMFASASIGYVVIFVLGVLGVTTEFRYQTITPTVLATPSRWTLITAKMISYAILGLFYAAVCLIVQLAIAIPWLSAKKIHYSLGSDHIPHALIGVLVVLAVFGIIGLGVGALLKNQIVAVTVGVIFLVALQNIFLAIPGVKHIFPYLPGGAVNSIVRVNPSSDDYNGIHILSTAGGVVVLLLWALVPAILGAGITMNRDIT